MNIKSFISVIPHIKPNTLIICDIDDTFLRYEKGFGYFYDKMKQKSKRDVLKQTNAIYREYKQKNYPKFTDYPGFMLMLHILRIRENLCF